MAISSKAQLRNAARQFLMDRDLSLIFDNVLGLAEDRIFRDTRMLRYLEAAADLTISSAAVAVPSGFGGVRRLYIDSSLAVELEYLTPGQFWPIATANTQAYIPSQYTIENWYFYFTPAPDATYTGKLLYHKRLDRLVNDGDTNEVLNTHAGVYLYAVLIETRGLLGDDPRMLTWASMWDDCMDALDAARILRNYPAGIAASTDVYVV